MVPIYILDIDPGAAQDLKQRRHTVTSEEQVETRGQTAAARAAVSFRELARGEDGTAFRTLNEEWISKHFVLEQRDVEQLRTPETILDRGGRIFLAERNGEAVGCVALIPMGDGVFELSKMAVTPAMRGLGIGRSVLLHAVAVAKRMGAAAVYLGSSTKLVAAVTLYESVGFRHVDPASLPKMAYGRADVFMRMEL